MMASKMRRRRFYMKNIGTGALEIAAHLAVFGAMAAVVLRS